MAALQKHAKTSCGVDIAVKVGYDRGNPPRDVLLMSTPSSPRLLKYGSTLFPLLLAIMGLLLVVRWVGSGPAVPIVPRVPGRDQVPVETATTAVRPEPGEPISGPGRPSTIAATWPCFRGPDHDAINKETVRLARTWPPPGPSVSGPCPSAMATPPRRSRVDAFMCSITFTMHRAICSAICLPQTA